MDFMKMDDLIELLADPGKLHTLIELYKPTAYSIIKEFVGIYKDLQNSEYYALNATGKRKAFDAYRAEGFSEDQAMVLILNDAETAQRLAESIKISSKKSR